MIKQLLYSLLVFVIVFVGLNVRMIFIDGLSSKRELSFKKNLKSNLLLSLIGAIAFFVIEQIFN